MNMAINVYEYGRGGKCVYMFRYTYAGILHVIENIREKEVRIKGAGGCIEICMYIWMQA